ncbi:MAG: hypothetical protein CME26_13230 [Gemmatimonadetes bacterium]|nr:hypothetical protein [Gemmatimonadota bacterium]
MEEQQQGPVSAPLFGVLVLISFLVESGNHEASGKLLRALVLTAFSVRLFPILRLPTIRRFSAWSLWIGFWMVLLGQWLAGLFPDYEIVALHLTFVGGFTLITLIVSTRVIAAHCGAPNRSGAPKPGRSRSWRCSSLRL